MTRAELKQELIDAGIRPSVQRLAIFEYVRKSRQHPTAEVVYEALRDQLGSLSLTTVYNTLKLFVDAGLVRMLTIDDTFRCFDGDCSRHADFVSLVDGLEGFEVTDAHLYLKGLCPECLKNN